MKVRLLRISVLLLLMEGALATYAQVYQTAQPASAVNAYTPYSGIYSSTPITTGSTADYVGAVNPYANTKFTSTAVTPSSYTITVSALDMSSVGEAQDPSRSPGIMKAPPPAGEVVTDPIGEVTGGVPVGDGIWLLLACAVMMVAFRTWQLRQQRKCV